MSFKLYLSFLAASVVLIYAPGPVNLLTIEANDPRSGTAEFKAAAVRIEKPASV